MYSEVEKIFDERIRDIFKSKEGLHRDVLPFLLKHERKHVCIENLCSQLAQAEILRGVKFTGSVRDLLVHNVADMFMRAALDAKHEQLLTDAEKRRKMDEATRMEDLSKEFEAEQQEFEKSLRSPKIFQTK